ncbi:MAG: M28 family peptidase [Chloroflexi bacterium]|nr:M28 family peptidase [Chloroflexota bacterium]
MRIDRALLVSIILFGLIACAPPSQPTPTVASTLAPTVALAPASTTSAFDSARALEHNRALALDIGARVAGSEIGKRAGEYIATHWQNLGYIVERQEFSFDQWVNVDTRVEMIAPEKREIKARPIFYSPPAQVEAELVAIGGTGAPDDFVRANIAGKIALVQRGTFPFAEKTRNAANAGAVAAIIYNNAPGGYGGTLGEPSKISALALSGDDGKDLLAQLGKNKIVVKIASETRVEKKSARNIIATKRGATENVIVLGGHYDSVEEGQGANDNASGTAVLLELARVLAPRPTQSTLRFIAFDAEELGLYGSRHYVENLPGDARAKIIAMFNFDMLGGGSGPLLAGGDGAVGKRAREVAQTLNISARNFSLGSGAGSDHQPFQRVGIDTIFFSRQYDLLHTPDDVFAQVREEYLADAGRVALQTLIELDAR